MYNIKPGNDLTIKWTLLHTDGSVFPLVNYEYRLFYGTGRGVTEESETGTIEVDGNVLTWVFAGDRQCVEGKYDLQLRISFDGQTIATMNKNSAFCLSENGKENTSGLVLNVTSYCDYIPLQEAIQQARHATDAAYEAADKAGRTSIAVGSTQTLQPTQPATATGTWDSEQKKLTLSFGIPKGDKGDKGDQGNSGYQGAAGELEVVNNLTDGGETAALSAEMGKTLKGLVDDSLERKDITGWQDMPLEVNEGALVSRLTREQQASPGYCNTHFSVVAGEKYKIVGYSVNSEYCGLCSFPYGQTIVGEEGAFELEYTVPSGVTSLYVNAKMTGEGALSVKKWMAGRQTSEAFYQQIEQMEDNIDTNAENIDILRSGVTDDVYTYVEPDEYVTGKYITLQRVPTDSSSYNYAKYTVTGGDKFRIRGWNLNTGIPLAFVYAPGLGSQRLISRGSSIDLCAEAVIPDGYTTLYVNGQRTQPAIIHKITPGTEPSRISKDEICVMPYTQSIGIACDISRRLDDDNDAVIRFMHNISHPNKFFDFGGISFPERGEDGINNVRQCVMDYKTVTDYIMPVVVAAVNNADGDFPNNHTYFTGGFHGYGNETSGGVSGTMRQVSQSVKVDGVALTGYEAFVYGHKVEIDVINRLQGCNTEKEDGSGREILEQHIHIYADKKDVKVKVEFTALEAVKIYQMDGLGQYLLFGSFRLIGSRTKKGSYSSGNLVRPSSDDRSTCAIRSFNSSYFFEVGMDRTYGEGDCKFNGTSYNAQATEARKGYFKLVAGDPVELASGEMLSFQGYFDFGKIQNS